MRTLRFVKFWRLGAAERTLLLESLLVVLGVRLCLVLLPFKRSRRVLARFAKSRAGHSGHCASAEIERVTQALTRASAFVPGANTCLVRALAAQIMLERRGFATALHIGFARAAEKVEGHAWLSCGGRVVMGDDGDLGRFAVLQGG